MDIYALKLPNAASFGAMQIYSFFSKNGAKYTLRVGVCEESQEYK